MKFFKMQSKTFAKILSAKNVNLKVTLILVYTSTELKKLTGALEANIFMSLSHS